MLEIEGIEPWTLSFAESFLEIPLKDNGEAGVMDYYLVLSNFKHADRAHSLADQVISTKLQPVEVSMTGLNDLKRAR